MTNKIKLISKIFLPPILSTSIIYFSKVYIDFQYIISFGILVMLFNKNKINHRFGLSFLYSIMLSFLVLILSLIVGKGIYFINDEIFTNLLSSYFSERLHVIPKSIVSPLLMFYSYKLLFKIKESFYFKTVKWTSVFILIIIGSTNIFFVNQYLFMCWQFVMLLALQLILYEKEIVLLVYGKKTAYNNGNK